MARPAANRIYKVVLTGGPCGGKTLGQDRLATFFEGLGWKVYRVAETATTIIKGGVRFPDLSPEQCEVFQEHLLQLQMRFEDLYVDLAKGERCIDHMPRNVLIICDRGTMDGSAYIFQAQWEKILKKNGLNAIDIRDKRYDLVIHMVTAAIDAKNFYSTSTNANRTEDAKLAADIDLKTREVWVGHPYVDIIDNKGTKNFDDKITKMIMTVCDRVGIQHGDRLEANSKKRKFLVTAIGNGFPKYQEFDVVQDFLVVSQDRNTRARIRKRGQKNNFFYTHTVSRIVDGERMEYRMQLSKREYEAQKLLADRARLCTKKKRRCFFYKTMYFNLDIYEAPIPRGLESLMILETYTTDETESSVFIKKLPPFLKVDREITGDPNFSLYALSVI